MDHSSLKCPASVCKLSFKKNVIEKKKQKNFFLSFKPWIGNNINLHLICLQTENFLKHKIRSRPERSELVRMHILQGRRSFTRRTYCDNWVWWGLWWPIMVMVSVESRLFGLCVKYCCLCWCDRDCGRAITAGYTAEAEESSTGWWSQREDCTAAWPNGVGGEKHPACGVQCQRGYHW